MKKSVFIFILALSLFLHMLGCSQEVREDNTMGAENTINFKFETLDDFSILSGSSYFMDFGTMNSEDDAAITEGKLLTVFGEPAQKSENYENSFNYIIRATSDDGQSVILNVYNVGVVHIGAIQQDDFAKAAAEALIEYVSAAAPSDFERTVYYLDFNIQIDIKVKNGTASIEHSEISDEKASELFNEWYS